MLFLKMAAISSTCGNLPLCNFEKIKLLFKYISKAPESVIKVNRKLEVK